MNNLIVKSFTTTKNGDNVKSVTYLDDNGVEVTISSASMLHGSTTLQTNGTYSFDDGEYAGVKTVVVNVETQGTIKQRSYNVALNRAARTIQIKADITSDENYDQAVNAGKVYIPDSRLTSKDANLSKSENVTVLPDHYGLSSVVVPPVDSRLILKDETLTGTQRRSNSCDMTSLIGQYGSEAGWVEVPIEENPNNQKYGYEAIFLPNTRLEYRYLSQQDITDWINGKTRNVINPSEGMFGFSSVVLPAREDLIRLQNKNIDVIENGEIEITFDNDYNGLNKVVINTDIKQEYFKGNIGVTINQSGYFYNFIQPISDFSKTIMLNLELTKDTLKASIGITATELNNIESVELSGIVLYQKNQDGNMYFDDISSIASYGTNNDILELNQDDTSLDFVYFVFKEIVLEDIDGNRYTIYMQGNGTSDFQ